MEILGLLSSVTGLGSVAAAVAGIVAIFFFGRKMGKNSAKLKYQKDIIAAQNVNTTRTKEAHKARLKARKEASDETYKDDGYKRKGKVKK